MSLAPNRSLVFGSMAMHSPSLQYGDHSPDSSIPNSILWPLARTDCICRPLNQTVDVRNTWLSGEVIHFIIEQETEAFGGYARAEVIVQSGSNGDCISSGIYNGVVGCVYGFVDCGCLRIHGCVLLKLAENLRALQILTCACVGWINRLAPGRGIPLIDELGYRNFREIGVAEKLCAVKECAAEGL